MFAVIPETADRSHRVRFKRPVRVVPLLPGPPRAFRVLAANLSRQGMFFQMPEPFAEGTQLALSLEAGGRVLPFAQCEVVWRRYGESLGTGFGVRFTGFLHPRAHELVHYLVDNLDRGVPLPTPKFQRFSKWALVAAFIAATVLGGITAAAVVTKLRANAEVEELAAPVVEEIEPDVVAPAIEVVAAPTPVPEPTVVPETPSPEPVLAAAEPSLDVELGEPTMVDAPAPKVAAKLEVPGQSGAVPMPKSAVTSLKWVKKGQSLQVELAMAPGASWNTVFLLRSPSRLVVDLNGPVPLKSHVLAPAGMPSVKGFRLGKLKIGTRLVIDFENAPVRFEQSGSKVLVQF